MEMYEKTTNSKLKNYLLSKLQNLDAKNNAPSLWNYMSNNETFANRLGGESGVIYNEPPPRTNMMMIEPNQMKTYDRDMIIDEPSKYEGEI